MKVDTPEVGRLIEKSQPIVYKGLCNRVVILRPPWNVETRFDTHVLVKAGAFGEPSKASLNGTDSSVQLLVS
jgi:hypothetical protein